MSGVCVLAETTVRHLEIYSDDFRSEGNAVTKNRKATTGMSEVRFVTRRRFIFAAGSTLAAVGLRPAFAQSRLRVDPTEFQPLPIAITNFVPGSPAEGQIGADVAGVITNNLKRSGLFAPIDQAAFIERNTDPDMPRNFQNWKAI